MILTVPPIYVFGFVGQATAVLTNLNKFLHAYTFASNALYVTVVTHTLVHMKLCTYVCMYVLHECMHVCMFACMYCMSLSTYVCMVCMYGMYATYAMFAM